MIKRTKVIATIGPASNNKDTLQALLASGVDVLRLNFSHGTHQSHQAVIALARKTAQDTERHIALMADIQGPKIRIGKLKQKSITLKSGQSFALDCEDKNHVGDKQSVYVNHPSLPEDVIPNDVLFIDDGNIKLVVNHISGKTIHCTVDIGGTISDYKGINKLGGGLSAKFPTEKDLVDIQFAIEQEIDYLALSFIKSPVDMIHIKQLLAKANSDIDVIAKIECAEAIPYLDEIISESDGIMIARGDLGVEMGDAELPAIQKKAISRARSLDRTVITATQMMHSMMQSASPTRAEVFDVANAVIDGTDAVMLSGETAIGKYPVETVKAVVRICQAAEQQPDTQISTHRLHRKFNSVDEAIAMASVYTANHTDIKAIAAFTESGKTPLWMSRINTAIPIFAFSRHTKTLQKVALYKDVFPLYFEFTENASSVDLASIAVEALTEDEVVQAGDLIIITRGDIIGKHGGTNRMKIVRVGDTLRR